MAVSVFCKLNDQLWWPGYLQNPHASTNLVVKLFKSRSKKVFADHKQIRLATGSFFTKLFEEIEYFHEVGIESEQRPVIHKRIKILTRFVKHLNWHVNYRFELEVPGK
jgi:hypothetical protein